MRQTLFTFPHDVGGVPLFGFGWLLLLWIGGCLLSLWLMVRKRGWDEEVRSFLPFVGLVGLAIALLLPLVEVPGSGLPVRGYGVMLLIATVTGISLALYRARQVGLAADTIYSLAFHMFVGGIIGARLFFIIQYWDSIYDASSIVRTIGNMVNFVEGGLVVYGSLIGALATAVWFLKKHRLPILATGDLIAPSMAVGLAIGRIGCLMNGCCYGDVCGQPWGVSFPEASPPYYEQHSLGLLHGFRLGENESGQPIVKEVLVGGSAEAAGLAAGETISSIGDGPVDSTDVAQYRLGQLGSVMTLTTNLRSYSWSMGEMPKRTLPIHPTQIYSSINAALLALLSFVYFPFRRRDGQVFALLIVCYAITRFMLEIIRTDEGAIFNSGLTISQNVSVAMVVSAALLAWYIRQQPPVSHWPRPAD